MHELAEFFAREWRGIEAAWPRHQKDFSEQTGAASRAILELAEVRTGMRVLDLASGTGEPALALARTVGVRGEVVATDVIAGPLQLLAAAAAAEALPQLRTQLTAMSALPFESASFDVVTCRLGIMFSPDVPGTLREVKRVLAPGGVAAFVVWGSPEQPLFECTLGVLRPYLDDNGSAGERPGPFRFAAAGALAQQLTAAGFTAVHERALQLAWPWPGPAESCWRAFVELSGPSLRAAVGLASQRAGRDLEADVIACLRSYERQGVTDPGAQVIGVSGRAP